MKPGNSIHSKEVRPPGFEPVTSPFSYCFLRERKRKWGWGESNFASGLKKERNDLIKLQNPQPPGSDLKKRIEEKESVRRGNQTHDLRDRKERSKINFKK